MNLIFRFFSWAAHRHSFELHFFVYGQCKNEWMKNLPSNIITFKNVIPAGHAVLNKLSFCSTFYIFFLKSTPFALHFRSPVFPTLFLLVPCTLIKLRFFCLHCSIFLKKVFKTVTVPNSEIKIFSISWNKVSISSIKKPCYNMTMYRQNKEWHDKPREKSQPKWPLKAFQLNWKRAISIRSSAKL